MNVTVPRPAPDARNDKVRPVQVLVCAVTLRCLHDQIVQHSSRIVCNVICVHIVMAILKVYKERDDELYTTGFTSRQLLASVLEVERVARARQPTGSGVWTLTTSSLN